MIWALAIWATVLTVSVIGLICTQSLEVAEVFARIGYACAWLALAAVVVYVWLVAFGVIGA